MEWRDDSAAHFQRIDTAQAGDQTVLTVYIDRLRPIANSGSTELAAITFSKSLPTEAFGAGAELIALDGNQEETVYASPALTVQGYSGGDDDRDNGVRDWDDVTDKGDGKTITLKLSPGEFVSQEVFVRAAEEKRNLRLDYGSFIWTFDTPSGVNIPAGRIYYDFSVEKLDYRNLSAAVNGSDLLQFEIAYSGALPCKATLACRVGDDHAGETVYLAYYDEAAAGLSGRGSAKVDADGWAAFAMTHASSYVISAKNLWSGPVQPETGGDAGGPAYRCGPAAGAGGGGPHPLPAGGAAHQRDGAGEDGGRGLADSHAAGGADPCGDRLPCAADTGQQKGPVRRLIPPISRT